jgi:RNA polymerase sigma-70 factor (sigma-E family)
VDAAAREDFRAYVEARSPALLRTAYLLTGVRGDAEDLLQTALAKTYLSWDRIRERQAVDAYVRRVLTTTAISWWRRRRVGEVSVAAVPEGPVDADPTRDADLHDALWRALGELPRRARAMVVLRYYEDLTEAEVAEALGVSTGTVKSAVSRALARLRVDAVALGLRDDDARLALPSEVSA